MAEKQCPKCGRNAAEDQAFCAECLAQMEKYPVKPGVVVLLPQRDQSTKPTKRRHHTVTPEERIVKLKKRISALTIALILALSAAGVFGWLALSDLLQDVDVRLPGQNYSSQASDIGDNTGK